MEDEVPLEETPARAPLGWPSDLGKRLLSGIIFAAVAIGLAWAGQIPFTVVVLVVATVMSWEWTRVVRATDFDLTLVAHAVAVATAAILTGLGYAALGLAALLVGTIIVIPLQFGERPIYSALGVLYAGLPAVALLWLRGGDVIGFTAVLFIFLVVWATDTAAFIAGRLIGGPKLAPAISPNKTWSGVAGGLLAGTLTAAVFAVIAGASLSSLAITGVVTSAIAQIGDLAESAL
jgi:phosphatidate cytidylyltransferase